MAVPQIRVPCFRFMQLRTLHRVCRTLAHITSGNDTLTARSGKMDKLQQERSIVQERRERVGEIESPTVDVLRARHSQSRSSRILSKIPLLRQLDRC